MFCLLSTTVKYAFFLSVSHFMISVDTYAERIFLMARTLYHLIFSKDIHNIYLIRGDIHFISLS